MSAVDHFGNPLVQKPAEPDGGTPGTPVHTDAVEAVAATEGDTFSNPALDTLAPEPSENFAESRLPDLPEAAAVAQSEDTVTLPLLGTASVARHQRVLFTLLGVSLLVLTLVAGFSLRKADSVAQQLAATGQSLMQSQRLAKSVSQDLIGSPQAFPDVVESASVLAKNVRALNEGDSALGVDSVLLYTSDPAHETPCVDFD